MGKSLDTTQRDRHYTWLDMVVTMPFPSDDEAAVAALRKAHATKPVQFRDFKLFCAMVGVRYGRFGTNIKPALTTMAEDFDIARTTAQRYMTAAVELGMFRRVCDATTTAPAVYEIDEFWLPASTATDQRTQGALGQEVAPFQERKDRPLTPEEEQRIREERAEAHRAAAAYEFQSEAV